MKKVITLCAVVICLTLTATTAFPQQQPNVQNPPKQNFQGQKADVSKDVPAEMQSAMAKLQDAKNELSHAGGEWGGFRDKAVDNINEAIANLNKAIEYRAKNLKK